MTSIVLSGGGVRGFAHAGVLGVIHSSVKIKEIVGCSMGGLIGALYCANKDAEEMMDFVLHIKTRDIIFPSFSKRGLIKSDRMVERMLSYLGVYKFSDLTIPLVVNATDLKTGEEVVFDSGRLDKALMASSAYPGVFVPVSYKNKLLVDGGISEPFPLHLASHKKIVGVNVSYGMGLPEDYNNIDVLKQCVNVLQKQLAEREKQAYKKATIIRPKIDKMGTFDTRKKLQCIRAGMNAAKASELVKLK